MFFFQDDVGLLIQLKTIPFWQFIITPHSEHFAPVLHLLSAVEYRLFGLNFIYYVATAVIIHIFNLWILFKLAKALTQQHITGFLAVILFSVNLTYTEPMLWFAANGVLLATFFLGVTYYFWMKFTLSLKRRDLIITFLGIISSGLSYGVGVGTGLLFALSALIYRNRKNYRQMTFASALYLFLGVASFALGPLIAGNKLGRIRPEINNIFFDWLKFLAFVVAGVSRGAVGRLFLPGFEPRHFQIIPSILSFIPFLILSAIILYVLVIDKSKVRKATIASLIVFIVYPYVWAGFLRYQFGLKQALAERYAYPSLFFLILLLAVLIGHFLKSAKLFFRLGFIACGLALIFFQARAFIIKAYEFEKRPLLTKVYFSEVEKVLKSSNPVLDLPLPSYINQPYTISQLAPVLTDKEDIVYIDTGNFRCTGQLKEQLLKNEIYSFYKAQVQDGAVSRFLTPEDLQGCKTLPTSL